MGNGNVSLMGLMLGWSSSSSDGLQTRKAYSITLIWVCCTPLCGMECPRRDVASSRSTSCSHKIGEERREVMRVIQELQNLWTCQAWDALFVHCALKFVSVT